MRNFLLTFMGIFLMFSLASAQQVDRDYVVVEEATGFW